MIPRRTGQFVRVVPVLLAGAVLAAGCYGGDGYGPSVNGPAAPGGDTTVGHQASGAFSQPAANLSDADLGLFRVGDVFFTDPWTPAGEGPQDRDGLGPTFLATSCAGCHPADGRGAAPTVDGHPSVPIVRFADEGGRAVVHDAYGIQVQTRSVGDAPAEAAIEVTWHEEPGSYPDGESFSLRSPRIELSDQAFGAVGSSPMGLRVAPNLIGLGLLEAIPEPAIREAADPIDSNADGISGVASDVLLDGEPALGRFGLKANVATVVDQVASAYLFDLGITSPRLPEENCPGAQTECRSAPSGGSPEISADRLGAVVLYAQTLAVPARIGLDDASIVKGNALFDSLGCSDCHTRRWETGSHDIDALQNQTIYPYTDLLLHDMGEGLSDGRSDGSASTAEWRTTPLWGIGLVRTVNPNAGFLHDGRARSIEEAILWHGGEAYPARTRFMELPVDERARLLFFLKSL